MPSVKYGSKIIEYTVQVKEGLKSHYVVVEKDRGVVFKGKAVSPELADRMVLKKARWILKKLDLVTDREAAPLVTGSRILYLGRWFYAEVVEQQRPEIAVEFNHSKFKIAVPPNTSQSAMQTALEQFYREKAEEKITPRIKKLAKETGLDYRGLRFRKLEKSWGNCSPRDIITIHPHAIKLPYSLIDYLIVHELCHTRVKDHSKQFWAELARHVPDWRELNSRVEGMKG